MQNISNLLTCENRRVLVTGASGGIGAAIARYFHDSGAFVVLHGTRKVVLDELAAQMGNKNVAVVTANLSAETDVEDLINRAEQAAEGGIDILVNNAGITRDQLILRMKSQDWHDVITTNLTASFTLCRNVIKGMIKRRWGRIINVSSVVAATGNPGQANYCAAKAGMIGLTKSLAREVASRGVTVNAIAPGFIQTPMTDVLSEEQKTAIMQTIPLGRLGTSEEIAMAALYLASQAGAYITGQTLHVNGGMYMG